jgi:hypothetical protein
MQPEILQTRLLEGLANKAIHLIRPRSLNAPSGLLLLQLSADR